MIEDATLLKLYSSLTERQQEVLELTGEELTNDEIGRILCIESCVVAGHLTNVFEEMGVLDEFAHSRPTRRTIIRVFAGFFDRYPSLRKFGRV